jgi:hypothetical protein
MVAHRGSILFPSNESFMSALILKPIPLELVIKHAPKDLVITEALKISLVETAASFGLQIEKKPKTVYHMIQSENLYGCESFKQRLTREKVQLKRPKHVSDAPIQLREESAKMRERTREYNKELSIKVDDSLIISGY